MRPRSGCRRPAVPGRGAPEGRPGGERAHVHRRGPPLRARARDRAPADAATPYEVALDGESSGRSRTAVPAERLAHAHGRGPRADHLRLLPRRRAARAAATRCARTRTRGREVDALRGFALRMTHARPERVAARAAAARRPGLRRRGPPATSRSELDGDGLVETLRRLRRALHRRLGRAGHPLAALDRPQRDDLRRPRRPRRLEHVDRVGHRDAPEGLVARRIVAAFESYLDLPAPREPLADRARATSSSTSTCARPRTRRRGCARSPSRPTRRSRARAGASAATSARPAW